MIWIQSEKTKHCFIATTTSFSVAKSVQSRENHCNAAAGKIRSATTRFPLKKFRRKRNFIRTSCTKEQSQLVIKSQIVKRTFMELKKNWITEPVSTTALHELEGNKCNVQLNPSFENASWATTFSWNFMVGNKFYTSFYAFAMSLPFIKSRQLCLWRDNAWTNMKRVAPLLLSFSCIA